MYSRMSWNCASVPTLSVRRTWTLGWHIHRWRRHRGPTPFSSAARFARGSEQSLRRLPDDGPLPAQQRAARVEVLPASLMQRERCSQPADQ